MGEKRTFKKIVDLAAQVVFWHDEKQIEMDQWCKRAAGTIVNAAAAVISLHDNIQARFDRLMMILTYKSATRFHKMRENLEGQTKKILGHFTIILLTALAMVAIMNYSTGYEYYYNGRALGYVRHQSDVTKILNLVSAQLSEEAGVNINIREESDIEFKPVFILDKELDSMDTVLKRFTYLTDTKAQAYGIYADGKRLVICKDAETAEKVLEAIKAEYVSKEDNIKYESIGFKEDVEIRAVSVSLKKISSYSAAKKAILNGGEKEISYKIKSGDAISTICEKYDISIKELKKMNPDLDVDLIHIGDKLIINKATSAIAVKTVSIEKYGERIKHKTKYVENDSMYKGTTNVIQSGKDGKRAVTAKVTRVNGDKVKTKVIKEKIITEPVTEIIEKGTKIPPKTAATGTLTNPAPGHSITSYFGARWGRMHEGIDLGCPVGTSVRAADGGTVESAGWHDAYGICIIINHGNGMKTLYAHNSGTYVSAGDKVYKGQVIASSGSTGRSTGPHLHFEVIVNGSVVDPLNYI